MDTPTRAPKDRDDRGMRLTPPRFTGAELRAKGSARITLTTAELEHLSRLIRGGRVVLNDRQPVSKNLRTAMTKLGVDTYGV